MPTEIAPSFTGDSERWQAVIDRDRAADAAFVFSVRSTGVYCRPSCPARRPKRENVCFHGTCAEAEQAGFRPCKRCKPNEATLAECNATAIAQACRAIEAADAPPRLDEMAENAGMSRFHFHRVFKEITGVTPKAYADSQRRARVQGGLARSATTTTEAIYDAGFNSNGRFYDTSNALIGMTPTAYRAGGEGEAIRFAVGECGLGSILVAATDKGVCAILLGDDPDVLVHDLQDRFCQAQLTGGDARFEQWVARVVGFVDAPAWELNLPLDIRGTAFQQQVWQALQDIPPGATANYAEIARRIGRPKSARAVARACCANPLAVAIPCHRVIRGDGGLAGYRWGIARKRALLEREAMASE
jgi:AraC family transcriptional regulator of adaptative response/methylated-DNA-[protein]-cysteine methyltransferase